MARFRIRVKDRIRVKVRLVLTVRMNTFLIPWWGMGVLIFHIFYSFNVGGVFFNVHLILKFYK